MIIEWKSSYKTNIHDIDEQHKKLVDLINRLDTKADTDIDHDFIYDVFSKLVEYTKEHFTFEEKMLLQHNYPEYRRHKAEHDIFVKKIAEYLKNSRRTDFNVSEEIFRFLKHWFVNHILKNDIEYSKYLGKYKND